MIEPGDCHLEWWLRFDRMRRGLGPRHGVIMAPKRHAKSTIWNKAAPLYVICHDHEVRCICASVNSELALRFSLAVRTELEQNQLLNEDFGPFKPLIPKKWALEEFIVERTSTSPSPTLRIATTQGEVQGGRSDWIFADDVCSTENCSTSLQRDKTCRWIDEDLLGTLEPMTGRAIFVGTAKNFDDYYHRIKKKVEAGNQQWFFLQQDSIVNEETHEVLWPEAWPYEELMARKETIGTVAFNRDMRCRVTTDETSLFPMPILEAALRHELKLSATSQEAVFGGIDYAIVESEKEAQELDSDWTVWQIWQLIDDDVMRLVWMDRYRGLGFKAQQDRLCRGLMRFPAIEVVVSEANQAQRWMASEILQASRGTLPIVKHSTSRLKADVYEGIPSISAMFEAGKIELPYGDEYSRLMVDVLISELHGLGVERHDDTVMALYMSVLGRRRLDSGFSFAVARRRR